MTTNPFDDPAFAAGLRPIPAGPVGPGQRRPAVDLTGSAPDGSRVAVRIGEAAGPVLLCFLHDRCDGCLAFWRGLSRPPGGAWPSDLRIVAVTRGAGAVGTAEVARLSGGPDALGPPAGTVTVVMSDRAWEDYRVTGYPFFVLVDPVSATVVGEAVGFGWPDVLDMVRVSLEQGPGGGRV